MFGAYGRAASATAVAFISRTALEAGVPGRVGLRKRPVAVAGTRSLRKRDLIHNGWQPRIEVDPQTYEVRADGELLTCQPATELPMAQRYFLF
jgi:urease subunit alpha